MQNEFHVEAASCFNHSIDAIEMYNFQFFQPISRDGDLRTGLHIKQH